MEAKFFNTGTNSVKKGRFGFIFVSDQNMETRYLVGIKFNSKTQNCPKVIHPKYSKH